MSKPIPLGPWPLGVDNVHNPSHRVFQVPGQGQPPARLRGAANIDLDDEGWPTARPGTSVIRPLAAPQGLWSIGGRLLYQDDDTLYEGDTALVTGLTQRVALAEHAGLIWGSDGTTHFVINGATVSRWGLPVPTVTVSAVAGAVAGGRYLVQGSWSDALGNEGGVSDLVAFTVDGTKAISVAVTGAVPDGATHLNIYASQANQTTTSFVAKVAVASLPYTILAAVSETDPPVTEQMTGPWSGLAGIASFRAFVLIWRDNVVAHSEAQEPHLFHADSIWQFPATVQAVETHKNGAWVATTRGLWWVSGEDPAGMIPEQKTFSPCVKGSLRLQGQLLPMLKTADPVALFVCEDGPVAGLADGTVFYLTKGRYQFDTASRVSLAYIERDGMRQLHIAMVT